MRAHGIPKWGYAPVTGCVWLCYSALNFVGSGLALFFHDHWRSLLDRWVLFSEPLVKQVGRFVPAVDSFEAKLLLLSSYSPAVSREADIPMLRNIVAMNSLLFAMFAVAIALIGPLEARRAVRRYGTMILENADGVLENPIDYGLPPNAIGPVQRWLMKNTGVRGFEIAIAAGAVVTLLLCYYGSDYVAVYSFVPGFAFGLIVTSGLYWLGEMMIALICFFVPMLAFSLLAKRLCA